MAPRLLALAAAVWTAGCLALYLHVVTQPDEGGGIAGWVVGVLAIAIVAGLLSAAGVAARVTAILCAVLVGAIGIVALLTIGVVLLPGCALAVVAAVLTKRSRPAGRRLVTASAGRRSPD